MYAAWDLWECHKALTETALIQEILTTLPQSQDSGRRIVVISNVDSTEWELLRGYAGISPEADIIIEPGTDPRRGLTALQDLARKLQTLAKAKLIARLTFFGVGTKKGSRSEGDDGLVYDLAVRFGIITEDKKVTLKFTMQQREINSEDFIDLRKKYPNLPDAFTPDAQVVFFNCWAGSDISLLQAAGEAFLRHKGGDVIANPKPTNFKISACGMFWSKKSSVITWIDRPDTTNWFWQRIQAESK